MHSTNYTNTFIETAEDCKADVGMPPPVKEDKTIAGMQFELIHDHPYEYTSDDVLFTIWAARNHITEADMETARAGFFSKGQACLRSSPLAKTYGWGIHHDEDSRVAIYARGSDEYAALRVDRSLRHVKAMRSSKA
ncbi:MAG: hypothetical protein IPK16_08155 [Anaerolineales bacterium]|nr:hypothetical protein [Anaerolineales bacterium]